MSDSISLYKKKTRKSAKIFSKSKKLHVNGVQHNIRFFEPYPFVTKDATSKFLIDVDNNKYVDYWMGHWSLILGHTPKPVLTQVKKQLKSGWMYGTVNEMTMTLSDIIQKSVPVAEKIRYVSTGTEATMFATRIARAVTKKKKIAKIDGGWHGYGSDLLKTVNWPFRESEDAGLIDESKIVSIPYNNLEKSLSILRSVKKDLAGVIIEPFLGGGGCVPATKEYLKGIQDFAHKNNSLFMLDEIVTGFRFSFGCLYKAMNLDPDIVTLGKIAGGGFPIGIICGKKEFLNYANTHTKKKSERAYIGGGTFSANPISMVGGSTTLSILKKNSQSVYTKINRLGANARNMLNKVFDGKVITTGKGSLFMTHFLSNGIKKIRNSSDVAKCNTKLLHDYHFEMISKNGIFFLPGKLGAFCTAHSQSDLKNLVNASSNFAAGL